MKVSRTMLSVQATPDISGIRTASLFSQDYTIIPCVALVEGVLWPNNSPAPELALAAEFGRFPEGWNGRPVVYDHPTVDGIAVSASEPNVLESNAFGQMYNTVLDGTKLKTEIWINETRVSKMSEEAQSQIAELKAGNNTVEVSTGLFMMSEPHKGVHEGQEFEAIWRNIVPDHLAILPKGIRGACSIEDGCGAPRTNNMKPVMRAAQLNINATQADTDDCACQYLPTQEDLSMLQKFAGWCTNTLSGAKSGNSEFVPADAVDDDKEGVTTLGNEAVSVRPVTTFVPVNVVTGNSINQENVMTKQELVNALVANEATQYAEEDSEWLLTLSEDQLAKMDPKVVTAPATNAEPVVTPKEPEAPAAVVEPVTNNRKPITTEEYVAAAPAELRQVLNASLSMHRQRKEAMVNALLTNSRNKYSKQQLDAKDIDELENIVALSQTEVSYEGAGANLVNNSGADDAIPAAPSIFASRANAA